MTPGEGRFDLARIGAAFEIDGVFAGGERYGSGHINDTFRTSWRQGGVLRRYVHQRINETVFPDPVAVMANVFAVVSHLRARLATAGVPDLERRVLTLVPARDGRPFWLDDQGACWRTYRFVEGSRTVDIVESEAQAAAAARAFGEFQSLLSDYAGPRLAYTIVGFHDTPRRFSAFARALAEDRCARAAGARAEVDFALGQEKTTETLSRLTESGLLPERVVHNDTKLNNLLLDDTSGEPLCVIDLDTVMPGLTVHDFGDLVRTGASRATEDERDLARVRLDLGLYEALVRGYLSSAGPFLTTAEREHLATGAEVIVLETGLRFLTDHLEGDGYFRVHREGQNLDRARVQFHYLRDLLAHGDELRRRIEDTARLSAS